MLVSFCLDDGQWHIGFVVEDYVGGLNGFSDTLLTTNDDFTVTEFYFLPDLHHGVPACLLYGGHDELGDDVGFAELFLGFIIHNHQHWEGGSSICNRKRVSMATEKSLGFYNVILDATAQEVKRILCGYEGNRRVLS